MKVDKEKRFKITYWIMLIIIIFLTITLVNMITENRCIVEIGENTYTIEAHGDFFTIEVKQEGGWKLILNESSDSVSLRGYGKGEIKKYALMNGESQEIDGKSFSVRKEGTLDIIWKITIITEKKEKIVLTID